ncbi:MAG TPA: hypothetical protein VGR72_13550 [Candidatus Acidoferrales bacterium]|nr:hypothetical protein [Candidatus Acidoferrales bacterium]
MPSRKSLPEWLSFARLKPALFTGLVLFLFSYGADIALGWFRHPSYGLIFNDLAVGIVGALLLVLYLTTSYENDAYARAKERMILVLELNHHIRRALSLIEESAMVEDREERVRRVDAAIARIDFVLTDLVPTIGSASTPRYELPLSEHKGSEVETVLGLAPK